MVKGGFSEPALQLSVDTTGKTTAAFFTFSGGYSYFSKFIDNKSSQILKAEDITFIRNEKISINIKDYEKEFGGDPSKLKKSDPKKFAAAETRVTQKYLPKINEMKMEEFFSNIHLIDTGF